MVRRKPVVMTTKLTELLWLYYLSDYLIKNPIKKHMGARWKGKISRKTKWTENVPNSSFQNNLILQTPGKKKNSGNSDLPEFKPACDRLAFSVTFTSPLEVIGKPLIVHNHKFVSHCTEVWNQIAYPFTPHFNKSWYSKSLLSSAFLSACITGFPLKTVDFHTNNEGKNIGTLQFAKHF